MLPNFMSSADFLCSGGNSTCCCVVLFLKMYINLSCIWQDLTKATTLNDQKECFLHLVLFSAVWLAVPFPIITDKCVPATHMGVNGILLPPRIAPFSVHWEQCGPFRSIPAVQELITVGLPSLRAKLLLHETNFPGQKIACGEQALPFDFTGSSNYLPKMGGNA